GARAAGGDEAGPRCGLGAVFLEIPRRGEQPRHADGKTGRRHRLVAEARDEAVVTAAAADRAETNGAAFVVLGVEQEFDLEDGAGVVLQATNYRGIYPDAISAIVGRLNKIADFLKFVQAFLIDHTIRNPIASGADNSSVDRNVGSGWRWGKHIHHSANLLR